MAARVSKRSQGAVDCSETVRFDDSAKTGIDMFYCIFCELSNDIFLDVEEVSKIIK